MSFSRPVANVALAFVIVLITLDGIPINFPGKIRILQFVSPVLNSCGLRQTWRLFSPLPPRRDTDVGAVIFFKDGSNQFVWLPRIQDMKSTERYMRERFRKYETNFLTGDHRHLADAARYVARRMSSKERVSIFVRLVQRDLITPPPGQGTIKREQRFILFDYRVQKEDLQCYPN